MTKICSIKGCSEPSVWICHTAEQSCYIGLCKNHYDILNYEIRSVGLMVKTIEESFRTMKKFLDDPESVAPATRSKMKKALQDAGVISVKVDDDQLWGRPKDCIVIIDRNFYDKISRIVRSLESGSGISVLEL